MHLLSWIILFCLIGGILSVLAASLFLLVPQATRAMLLPHGISFATGALLAVSFGGLIPHAFGAVGTDRLHEISMTIMAGLLAFFMLEKLLLWRHCHTGDCAAHAGADDHSQHGSGSLILFGDSIHNFLDGILIAAAFLTDLHLGVVTSLAVAAHEIPQEVGDFAILLHSGYSRARALWYNVLASLTTVFGGVLAYAGLGDLYGALPYFLAIAAASFIYIAVADLIPTLHQNNDAKAAAQQIILIATGVVLMISLHRLAH
jgi:zinc and cadmium transporter